MTYNNNNTADAGADHSAMHRHLSIPDIMRLSFIISAAMAVSFIPAKCEVTLPQIIADNMVVQCDAPVAIWGKALPGEIVRVTANRGKKGNSYKKAEATVKADTDGRWIVELPPMKTGSSYIITVNEHQINNVTPGYVFLCSGQSNMELPVRRVTDMFADEVAACTNLDVREFAVPNDYSFEGPLDDVRPTAWKSINPDDGLNFSALAYFFGKEMNTLTGVPVGLVRSCWGGTPVEAWMSDAAISDYPRAVNQKRIYDDPDYRYAIKQLEQQNYYHWNSVMDRSDPGLTASERWYSPTLDISDWTSVDLLDTSWATDGLNPVNGSHWFRKDFTLDADAAGREGVIRMGCIVDADSVYVNGVFVGSTGYQYPPRIYKIPAGVLKDGTNNVTVRLISQSGTPHFVPEKPYKVIVGDREINLDGDWSYHQGAPMIAGPAMEFWCYKPVVLYNAMIAPLSHCRFAGVVWYQGESNVDTRNLYSPMLQSMIADWRNTFDDDNLKFYIVELADFLADSDVDGRRAWAEMREQQADAVKRTPGARLIHNSDLGEWNDIHPLDKKTLAKRICSAVMDDISNN